MSKLQQLKGELYDVARQINQITANIAAFESKFSQSTSKISNLIGGTATGDDKKIGEALDAASKAVGAAVRALEQAKKTAEDYAKNA